MLINCYYYAPHNHELLAEYLRADLDRMVDLGCDAVSVCVQEDQLANWHQARLRNLVDEAHARGLAVHAVPNRWCGLTAGWLDGFSKWSLTHPETWFGGRPGASDPAHPAVVEHYRTHIDLCLTEFGFDGMIWDEPRPARQEVIDFLDAMSAYCHEVKPDCVVSMFAEAGNLDMAEVYAKTTSIDYLGADGHVRRDEHRMHRMKNTIFTTHATFHPVLTTAGKKTFFLPEAQRHRDEDLDEYLACLERAFTLPMDHLLFYYSAHEMGVANEERFNAATWAMVKRLAGK